MRFSDSVHSPVMCRTFPVPYNFTTFGVLAVILNPGHVLSNKHHTTSCHTGSECDVDERR